MTCRAWPIIASGTKIRWRSSTVPAHDVTLAPGGLLHRLHGRGVARVNSVHGQGAARLAPGLVVEATAPDGLVEAFSGQAGSFLLGVQWHPEWMFRDNALSTAIFAAFGEAARAGQARVRQTVTRAA